MDVEIYVLTLYGHNNVVGLNPIFEIPTLNCFELLIFIFTSYFSAKYCYYLTLQRWREVESNIVITV